MQQLTEIGAASLVESWCSSKVNRAGITKSTRESIGRKCRALLSFLTTDDPLSEQTIMKILDADGQYSYRHRLAQQLVWTCRWAAENHLIPDNPLKKVRLPRPRFDHCKYWLSPSELDLIKSLPIAGKLAEIRDFFLLQCHTGLAYVDVQAITRMSTYEASGREWIKIVRRKTKQTALIPINNCAREILDRYNWRITMPCNQKYNTALKQIQHMAGIEKKLHSHIACKTFVQLYLSHGLSPQATAQMRGITVRTLVEHYGTLNECTLNAGLTALGL